MPFFTDLTQKNGVFYRFNAKNWRFFTDLTQKIGVIVVIVVIVVIIVIVTTALQCSEDAEIKTSLTDCVTELSWTADNPKTLSGAPDLSLVS